MEQPYSQSSNGAVYAYAPYQPNFYDATPNYVAPPAPPPSMTYGDEGLGSYCREFSQEIHIAGRVQESYGTACLATGWHMARGSVIRNAARYIKQRG